MAKKLLTLGRTQQFDERSRAYSIMAGVKSRKNRSYTWRCNQTLDQGREGACVGAAVTHELIARPSEVQGLDMKFAREQIYYEAQKIDPWEGGEYPNATRHMSGTSVLAGVKVAHGLGWFDSYRWAFGLDALIYGVGHNGPAIIGINWYNGMIEPDAFGYVHPTGGIAGGHCVLVNSVSMRKNRFTIHNSWGEEWGKNGNCYISFNDMETLLNQRGEAVFLMHRHSKPE